MERGIMSRKGFGGNLPSFDVFTGSDTGYLKGCLFSTKTTTNINQIQEAKKELGISSLTWGNVERSIVCSGCKYGQVFCYCLKTASCVQLHHDQVNSESKKVPLKDIRFSAADGNLIMAFGSGLVKISHFEDLFEGEEEEITPVSTNELDAGADLFCLDQNVFSKSFIATGGKKNPVKVWDITKPEQPPVFSAKNVKNDWLDLHVPVWVTKIQFLSGSNKLMTGNGHSQIRVYDPSTPQKRPVIEMKYEEYPITALCVRPGMDNQVVVGNTLGSIALLDLRKKGIVKAFKGARGGVTDIKFHPRRPVFVSCGVDRFVNCYSIDGKKVPLSSVYMHSSLNSVLVSSKWSLEDSVCEDRELVVNQTDNVDRSNVSQSNSDNEEVLENDDIWESMAVVKTKKRKTQVEDTTQTKKKKKRVVK